MIIVAQNGNIVNFDRMEGAYIAVEDDGYCIYAQSQLYDEDGDPKLWSLGTYDLRKAKEVMSQFADACLRASYGFKMPKKDYKFF